MAHRYGPKVTRDDSLMFYLDGANAKSNWGTYREYYPPNRTLHWDFSKLVGEVDGQDVTGLTIDQSGNGRDGVNANFGTGDIEFLEDPRGIGLSGVDDTVGPAGNISNTSYSIDGVQSFTAVYVGQRSDSIKGSNSSNIWSMSNNGGGGATGVMLKLGTDGIALWCLNDLSTSNKHEFTPTNNSKDCIVIITGNIVGSNCTITCRYNDEDLGGVTLGNITSFRAAHNGTSLGNFFEGGTNWGTSTSEHYEFLTYERVLTDKEQTDLVSFLKNKWNIPYHTTNLIDKSEGLSINGLNQTTLIQGTKRVFDFDGIDDYIDFGNPPKLNVQQEMTLECWFKTTTTGLLQFMVGRDNGTNARSYSIRVEADNTLGAYILNDDVGGQDAIYVTSSPTTVTDGLWHHGTVTVDIPSSMGTLYLDGQLVDTDITNISEIGNGATNVNVGRRTAGDFYFDGQISNAKIYNRVLTPTEVLNNYNELKHRFI